MFEESAISDTVVEFRATSKTALSKKNVIFGAVLAVIFLWSIVVQSYVAQAIVTVMLLLFLVFLKYNVREESITIIKNFGVQLRVRYLFGNEKVEFFDNDRINNVFIHEYFYGSQVRYSLAFIIKGQERMSLLFKHVYPGFEKMKRVYSACKQTSR